MTESDGAAMAHKQGSKDRHEQSQNEVRSEDITLIESLVKRHISQPCDTTYNSALFDAANLLRNQGEHS